jgi:hypothetical protein
MDSTVKQKRKYVRKSVAATPAEDVSVPAHEVVPSAEQAPGPLMLTQDELFKLRLFESELRAARAEAETCRMRKKWILALLDPKGTVDAEEKRQEKWIGEAKSFAAKYEAVKARASMRLGIDLNQCGFDTDTGVVVPPDSAKGKK